MSVCVCVSVTKDAKVHSPVKRMQLNLYKATRDRAFPSLLLLTMATSSAEGLRSLESSLSGKRLQREESSGEVTVLFTNSQIMTLNGWRAETEGTGGSLKGLK